MLGTVENFGCQFLTSTSDAPWTHGIAEKHGGILKLVLNRYFEDHKGTDPLHLPFADVLEEALAAKNETPGGAEVAEIR